MLLILLAYVGIAALTYLALGSKVVAWEQSQADKIMFSVAWPMLYTMFFTWGFGDLIDRITSKIFRVK